MLCAGRCTAIAADRIGRVLPSRMDKKNRNIICVEAATAQRNHRCLRLSFLLEASCNNGGHGAAPRRLRGGGSGGVRRPVQVDNVMLRTFVVGDARITSAR